MAAALAVVNPVQSKIMLLEMRVQWESEIRTCLKFKWSKRDWVANGLDFEWAHNSGSPSVVYFVQQTHASIKMH